MTGVPLQTLVLRRMASVKHKAIAEALGTDESTVSRIASGERGINLERLEAFLTELGLAVVEVGGQAVTVSRDKYRATQLLAIEALQRDLEERP